MNILLVTSPVLEPSSFSTLEKTPPLGLGYLMEVLRKDGHKVFFKDLYLNPTIISEIESFLVRESIELLGLSMNTICYSGGVAILKIAQTLREKNAWFGKIVVGGPHPSVFPETIPEYVDHICKGEGEEVIKAIANGESLPRIINGKKIQDMDNLPFVPYQEFISLPYHFSNQWINKNRVLTLNTSRGCPFSCQFCSVGSVWGNRYRFQSAERVIEEIIRLKKDFDAQGIYFREDNFTLNRKRVVEFCESILAKGLNLPWICETRANTLTEDMVKLMARAGCRGFYVGAESGSQRVLDYMKKGITLEQVENVVNWSKKEGIRCYLSSVIGVPTETEEERYATLFFIDRLKPYSYGLNVFTGIPFSPFYWQLIKDGNHSLITSSGIVYQKNHNHLVDQFVGNMDCRVPISAKDLTQEILPVLKKIGRQHTANTTLVLRIQKNSTGLVEKIRGLKHNLGVPALLILNCSGDDDVALTLTALGDKSQCIIKTLRPGQHITALNSALEISSRYFLFADFEDDLDIQSLIVLHQELINNNVVGVFRSSGTKEPILFKSLFELNEWLGFEKLMDFKIWACFGDSFRKTGGVDDLLGTAYLLDIIVKLVDLGSIKIFPAVLPTTDISTDDYKFFSQILQFRLKKDIVGIAALRQNYIVGAHQIGKKEEAVVHYFFGRAKLRARQFHSARSHFLNAFRKDVKLKYFLLTCATLLPSRSYSFFAKMVNKVKRI